MSPPPAPGKTRPQWLGNLALVLAGVVFALAVAEIALRASGLGEVSFYVFDRRLGWKPRPGAAGWQRDEGNAYVRVNSLGYRGPEVALAKPAGTFRIVVLGDSFAEAKQVPYDETFPALMRREIEQCPELRAAGYSRVEVLDFGCDGYGTAQELIALKYEGPRYSPDLVTLAVFTGNDIRNNSVVMEGDKCRPFYVERGGKIVLGGPFEDSWASFLGCWARFESRHFQVLNMMGRARSALRAWMRTRRSEQPTHPAQAAPAPVGEGARTEPGISNGIYMEPPNPVWKSAWDVTEWEIKAFADEAARHGARTLVVTLANPMQDHRSRQVRERYQGRIGVSDLFYPERRIDALCESSGIAVLNLAQPFQHYAESHDACLHGFPNTAPCTGHFNQLGHKLAADLITAKICAMLKSH